MEVDSSPPIAAESAKPSHKDDDEEEEEEFLIMADIGHDIDQQTVLEHAMRSEIRAIDIDGANPFVQIGPYTFQGQYNYTLGTNLFFSTTSATVDDTASNSSRTEEPAAAAVITAATPQATDLHLIGSSDKKLTLSRVYIYPKANDDETSKS